MHGDRAVVRVVRVDRDGRREGALVEVVERGVGKVVGRLPARERGGVRPPPQLADPPGRPHPAGRGSRRARRRLRRRARHRSRRPGATPPHRRRRGGARRPDAARNGDRRGHPGLGATGGVARGGRAGGGGAAFRSGRRRPSASSKRCASARPAVRRAAPRGGPGRHDPEPEGRRTPRQPAPWLRMHGLGRLRPRAAVRGRGSSATWPARCRRPSRHAERGSSGPSKPPAAAPESMEQAVTKAVPGH